MLLVDDLLVKPFLSILDIVQTMALNELFDVAEIKDDIKENRLLFEIGERDREAYDRRKRELENRLELAGEIRKQMSGRVEVMS